MYPPARLGDPATHDGLVGSGIVGPPTAGSCAYGPVLVEGMPAAYVGCTVVCTGATGAGPAHPPGAPPIPVAPSGTSSSTCEAAEPVGEEPSESNRVPEEKELVVTVLNASSESYEFVTYRNMTISIADPATGTVAEYSYHGVGVGFGLGPPGSSRSLAGEPVSFRVPGSIAVDRFDFATVSEESVLAWGSNRILMDQPGANAAWGRRKVGTKIDIGPTLGGGFLERSTTQGPMILRKRGIPAGLCGRGGLTRYPDIYASLKAIVAETTTHPYSTSQAG